MIESGLPGFDISAWYVMFAPANVPKDVMQRLNAEVNKAIADPELRKSLGEQGVEFTGGTSADADRFVIGEVDRWGKIIKTRGMSAN